MTTTHIDIDTRMTERAFALIAGATAGVLLVVVAFVVAAAPAFVAAPIAFVVALQLMALGVAVARIARS